MDSSKKPIRKPTRLKNYNYNWQSSYFLTLCTKNKECIFGKISKEVITDTSLSANKVVPVAAEINLSKIGKIAEKYITSTNTQNADIEVEHYVIMPNHIHLLIYVNNNNNQSIGPNAIIPKYVSSLKRLINKECGKKLFQRSYYDHIVRNDKDFDNIWNYIDGNPVTWEKDCFFTNVDFNFKTK